MMSERPILFTGEMVRAIIDGRKTQTRRVVKPMRGQDWLSMATIGKVRRWARSIENWWTMAVGEERRITVQGREMDGGHIGSVRCPYGQPGDLLYVRETFRLGDEWEGYSPGEVEPQYHGIDTPVVWYEEEGYCSVGPDDWGRIRQSIFMPKWATRLWLRVIDVRVERVREITPQDAIKEGSTSWANKEMTRRNFDTSGKRRPKPLGPNPLDGTARGVPYLVNAFAELWNSINAKRGFGWDVNPWVWVVSFERAEDPR